jgi:hypothetical protein
MGIITVGTITVGTIIGDIVIRITQAITIAVDHITIAVTPILPIIMMDTILITTLPTRAIREGVV